MGRQGNRAPSYRDVARLIIADLATFEGPERFYNVNVPALFSIRQIEAINAMMDATTIAIFLSSATFAFMIIEKTFGGGNKLANEFHKLDKRITNDVTSLRNEFLQHIDLNNTNYRVGLDAITANIHALQLGLLEFRAKMAEDYMRRDSYHKASDELKRDFKEANQDLKTDMQDGLERIEKQLDAMAQAIEEGRKAQQQRAN